MRRLTVLLAALLLALTGCAGGPRRAHVTVMVPWSGPEFQAFYAVVKDFEKSSGVTVDVQVTRALTQQLDAAVAAGAPPDLAMLPSVGAIDKYAVTERRLQPLDVSVSSYLQPFRGLATVGGTVYAVPVKADVKSLVWYDRRTTPAPPATLAGLKSAGRPWCLGLISGPTSGWPGADWIADILLAEGDGSAYQQWLSGGLKWNSPQVRQAWATWHDLVGDAALKRSVTLDFGDTAAGMGSGGCGYAHGARSALGLVGDSYAYAPWAGTRRLEVSADFVGMFTRGNPGARAFIDYLTGPAQAKWVREQGGYAFSADSRVRPADYTGPVQQGIAALLRPGSGYTLCFGAADVMRPDVSAAFYRAVLAYAGGGRQLGELLPAMDAVQGRLGNSGVSAGELCAGSG